MNENQNLLEQNVVSLDDLETAAGGIPLAAAIALGALAIAGFQAGYEFGGDLAC